MRTKLINKFVVSLLLICVVLTACGKSGISSKHEIKFSSLFDKERVWIVLESCLLENVSYDSSVVAIFVTKNMQVTEYYLYRCYPLPTLDHFDNMSLDDIREEINTTSIMKMENDVVPIEISGELDNSGNSYQYETASFPYGMTISSSEFECPIKILNQEYFGVMGLSQYGGELVFLTLNTFGTDVNLSLDEVK